VSLNLKILELLNNSINIKENIDYQKSMLTNKNNESENYSPLNNKAHVSIDLNKVHYTELNYQKFVNQIGSDNIYFKIEIKKELKQLGRPIKFNEGDIEELLNQFSLYSLDIEETNQPSKAKIHYTCDLGHENTTRFDTIKNWIKSYENNERFAACQDCHTERTEMKNLIDNEILVEEKGFKLSKMYNNERSDIIYDIICSNEHLTEGRAKGSFLRSFSCKECKHNANEYICSACQQLLPLDKFNKCETNLYRNKTDQNCKECREKQRNVRKENNYK